MTDKPTPRPKPPTPADLLFKEWRSSICSICEYPLDLQQRDPLLWFCSTCRKWFDRKLERI